MRSLIPLVLLALPLFAQTTPATEPPPPPEVIEPAPSYDDLYVIVDDHFRDNRCRDGLQFSLFDVIDGDSHKVQQYLPLRPLEGALPTERLRAGEPRSQRGPIDDPVKARRDCERSDPWPVVTAV